MDSQHLRLLEAILFASDQPLRDSELRRRLPPGANLGALLRALQEQYAGRGVHLVRAGRSWAFSTAPDLAAMLARETAAERRLSRAAIETLAIIAYHQPVTRPEIEDIRGVQVSKGTMDVLLQHGWIAPKGHREAPGRPLLWVTTDAFLRTFGLSDLSDLPNQEELRAAGLLQPGPGAADGSGGVADMVPMAAAK
jgi:segregation and condensation protein B